uniref:Uncharacterized protein n=1 Tax=Neolamprologus brichardi TaxID=32507 RepID=A0A3Q4H659_NEOBR
QHFKCSKVSMPSSVHSNSEDSTLIEGKDGEQGRVVFDDDDTWNDLEDTAIGTADESKELSPISKPTAREISPPQKTLLRKVAVSKGVELGKATGIGSVSLEPDHPPASQLMTKLFPSLKPKAQSSEERSALAGSQEKPPNQEHLHNFSPVRGIISVIQTLQCFL